MRPRPAARRTARAEGALACEHEVIAHEAEEGLGPRVFALEPEEQAAAVVDLLPLLGVGPMHAPLGHESAFKRDLALIGRTRGVGQELEVEAVVPDQAPAPLLGVARTG